MKAPDKIYCGNNGHGNLSYSREKIYDSMQEYICKNAVLKILMEAHMRTIFPYVRIALNDVIDKIKSL